MIAIKGIITVVIPLNPVFDMPMQSPQKTRATICQGEKFQGRLSRISIEKMIPYRGDQGQYRLAMFKTV
jgi:hypothetical protein